MKNTLRLLLLLLCVGVTFTTSAQNTQIGASINGEASSDVSGRAISMGDINTIAIGAPGNDGGGTAAGHVRVYSLNGSSWVQKGGDIDGEATFDESGFSVSMPDANTVAIGAPKNDGGGNNSGHVRVYTWNSASNTWVQKGADIDGEAAGDESGYSVSMPDANTIAVGAPFNNSAGFSDAGHVRVYTWNSASNSWVQKGADIDGGGTNDWAGFSVDMPDANTLVVGIPLSDFNGSDAGHVAIYEWNGTAWIQKGSNIIGQAGSDFMGFSVSMPNANTLATGAPGKDGNGANGMGPSIGCIYVYAWNSDSSAWIQRGGDILGIASNDRFGESVSMPDNNTLIAGAPQHDSPGMLEQGHARLFGWSTRSLSWCQRGQDIDGQGSDFRAGSSVSLAGPNRFAVGEPQNSIGSLQIGSVRVYDAASPEINVVGNGNAIRNGQMATFTSDNTDFGSVPITGGPVTRTFVIENVGTTNLNITSASISANSNFSIQGQLTANLSPGAGVFLDVVFNPTAAGVGLIDAATVVINSTDSDEGVFSFLVEGMAVATPQVTILANGNTVVNGQTSISTTDNTDFGNVPFPTGSVSRSFILLNSGFSSLTINSVSSSDPAFTVSTLPNSPLQPGVSTNFELTFSPTSMDTIFSTITVNSNDPSNGSFSFEVRGIGVGAADIMVLSNGTTVSVANGTDFGTVSLPNGTATQSFDIQNTGLGVLDISAINSSNASFSILNAPTSVAAGATSAFEVLFAPSTAGTFNGVITVESNAPNTPVYAFSVSGTATTSTSSVELGEMQAIVFPNPTSEVLRLQLVNWSGQQQVDIRIVDNLGQLIFQGQRTFGQADVVEIREVADLTPGSYYLQLNWGGEQVALPFVKR